jgi:hypothetical protein
MRTATLAGQGVEDWFMSVRLRAKIEWLRAQLYNNMVAFATK